MKQFAKAKALAKLDKVADIMPKADVLDFFSRLTDAYREHQVTKRDIARIEAQKDIVLTAIQKRYDAFYFVFNKIFEERRESIHKIFEVIDRGMKENDRELLSMGLKNLSTIVSSSPFSDIQQLSKTLEDGKIIEI
ncbi:MAG: hypothetical protein K6T83_13480 [Alicyclobacillus sp.]|nr:hypothetical protein [Alicyclobacillus sp.]